MGDSARTVGDGQGGWLSDRVSDAVNGDDSWRRTESRIVSSNDSGVLGDILRRLVRRRLRLRRLVLGRLRLGRILWALRILGTLGLLVTVLTTAGSN